MTNGKETRYARLVTEIRALVKAVGGLHSQSGLAKRWDVSKAYISDAVRHPDFPAPVTIIDGRPVWSGKEADKWRATPRRPGPRPRDTSQP